MLYTDPPPSGHWLHTDQKYFSPATDDPQGDTGPAGSLRLQLSHNRVARALLPLSIWASGIRDLGSGIHTGGMQDKNCSREGDKEWMRWKSQKLQTLQTSSTLICCCRPTCSADMSYSKQCNAMVGTTADVPLKVPSKFEVQTLLDRVKL